MVKNLPASAGDAGLIPGSGRSLEKGMAAHSSSYLENPMDRGTWWATVHRVTRVGHDLATKQQKPASIVLAQCGSTGPAW